METQLNLARKWRSKTFDELVGQDLSVRMLKNSLYLGSLFPVYLLWGQRGTGKTSLARIFAAALNCQQLQNFKKDPRNQQLPCLSCASCLAMQAGNHPDFIELDAASNTGVDHVRTIIESASLLPVLGTKKVYLIDEAHMLSKAAFNALLKMLEEPPAAAIFMLATTDPYKIIDTVRSRCFQLPLRALDVSVLVEHLAVVCAQELINFERDALVLVAHEAEGSVRDALNIIEQVRYAGGKVTAEAVRQVLGRVDDTFLLAIMQALVDHDGAAVMRYVQDPMYRQSDATYVWQRFVEFIRMLIWAHHGVAVNIPSLSSTRISEWVQRVPLSSLMQMLQLFYDHEQIFARTAHKHLLLELLLLRLCKGKSSGGQAGGAAHLLAAHAPAGACQEGEDEDTSTELDDESEEGDDDEAPVGEDEAIWQQFVTRIDMCQDMLLSSIMKQAHFQGYARESLTVRVAFSAQSAFFKEWLAQTRAVWQPVLEELFTPGAQLDVHFDESIASAMPVRTPTEQPAVPVVSTPERAEKPNNQMNRYQPSGMYARPVQSTGKRVDARLYPRAQMILRYFPGVLKEG